MAVCAVVGLSGSFTAAQAKPDFSGEWVLVRASNDTSPAPTRMIIHQAAGDPRAAVPMVTLTVERGFSGRAVSNTYVVGVQGGFVGGGLQGTGSNTSYDTVWEGRSLVFSTPATTTTNGQVSHTGRREVWTLTAQGELRVTITEEATGVEPRTTGLVYQRRD